MTKHNTPIDKGRPELGQAAHQGAGKLGAYRIPAPAPKDPSRQSVQAQLDQTQKAIDYNLKLVTRLVARGRMDQAGKVCEIVTRQRLRRFDLIRRKNEVLAGPASQEPAPVERKPKTRTSIKTKRYKTWDKE